MNAVKGGTVPVGVVVHGNETRRLEELAQRASRAAHGISLLGVAEGDSIAMLMQNSIASLEVMLAADISGAYLVAINWHLTDRELQYLLSDSGAKLIICDSGFTDRLARLAPHINRIVTGKTTAQNDSWEGLIRRHPPLASPAFLHRSNIVYTSGTTGTPKGVVRSPVTDEQRAGQISIARTVYGIGDDGFRTVICGPLYHGAPNFIATYALANGGFIVLVDRFDPEQLLRQIEEHKITHIHLVPTMMVRLLSLPKSVRQKYDLSSLRFICHAAAPCPPAIKAQMIEWLGLIVHEYYGGTETGPAVFCRAHDALTHPGSVGRPLPGVEIEVLDKHGVRLPTGSQGEIYISNPLFPDFTYRNRHEDRLAIERNGKVTVGDIGYVDEDGFLYLCDRAKDLYISGGVNIYSIEIENEILGLDGVQDCAVFGVPDDDLGEVGCALIVPLPGLTLVPDLIREQLRETLAGFKIPRRIEIRSSLPREDSGKLFKRRLREPYWQGSGRTI